MSYGTETHTAELKRLGYKYGIAAALLVLNSQFFVPILGAVLYAAASFMPNAAELADRTTDAGYVLFMVYNELASYLLPLLVTGIMFAGEAKRERGVPTFANAEGYKRFFGESLILYITGWFAASCMGMLTSYVSELLNSLFSTPQVHTAFSSQLPMDTMMYVTFEVSTCIVAPVCEELIYRRILLLPLRKYGDFTAAVVTALLFGLSHFNFDQFLYAFAFGFFLAVIAIRSDSVIIPIIFHTINNIIAGITVYLPETFGSETVDAFFASLGGFLETFRAVMLFIAVPAIIAVVLLKLLRLHNNSGIPVKKQLSAILLNPVFLLSVVIILAITVILLWS